MEIHPMINSLINMLLGLNQLFITFPLSKEINGHFPGALLHDDIAVADNY